jgi:hypothetical protein
VEASGQGQHTLQLDLSGFTALPGTCDLTAGLTYHIHSFWDDASGTLSGDNTACALASTGNHYDPYLACGPNTEESASCAALGRVAPNYTYPCTSEAYGNGQYEYCEVGDTSGKFGKLFATDTDMSLFSADVFDPSPELIPAYETASQLASQWASVVVHCGSSRILCAKFLPVSDSAACGNYDTSGSEEDDDDTALDFLDLGETEGALLWSGVIVAGVLGGVLVGYKVLHSTKEDSDSLLH